MSLKRKQGPLYQQIQKFSKTEYSMGYILSEASSLLSRSWRRNSALVNDGPRCGPGAVSRRICAEKSGVGTIVVRNTSHQKLSKGKRFTELLVEEGHKLEKRVLNSQLVTNDEGTEEYNRFGPFCQRIERLYILNGRPYIHLIHFLASAALPGGTQEMNTDIQSLYDSLEENDIMLENFRDRFFVEPAPPEVCQLLEIPTGMHVLKRLRNSYDGEGRLIEQSIGCYNTELHHYLVSYDT